MVQQFVAAVQVVTHSNSSSSIASIFPAQGLASSFFVYINYHMTQHNFFFRISLHISPFHLFFFLYLYIIWFIYLSMNFFVGICIFEYVLTLII